MPVSARSTDSTGDPLQDVEDRRGLPRARRPLGHSGAVQRWGDPTWGGSHKSSVSAVVPEAPVAHCGSPILFVDDPSGDYDCYLVL